MKAEEVMTREVITANDDASLEEIAAMGDHNMEEIEAALKVVQSLDPAGVGARNVVECLLLQIAVEYPDEPELKTLVRDHLEELERRQIPKIAKAIEHRRLRRLQGEVPPPVRPLVLAVDGAGEGTRDDAADRVLALNQDAMDRHLQFVDPAGQDGEVVEFEIRGIGRMRLNVRDPLKRSWEKGIYMGADSTNPDAVRRNRPQTPR